MTDAALRRQLGVTLAVLLLVLAACARWPSEMHAAFVNTMRGVAWVLLTLLAVMGWL
jgi:hypothetical protein